MKSFNALIVLATLLVIGQGQSRVASGSGNSVFAPNYYKEVDSRCPHDATTNATTILPFLLTKQKACITPSPTLKQRFISAALEHKSQEFFQNICALVPSARECMDQVATEATLCLNKMEAKTFKLSRENTEAGISATCDNASENVALIMEMVAHELTSQARMKVLLCLRGLLPEAKFHNDEPDLPAYTIRKYHVRKEARECVLNVAREQQVSTTNFDTFFDKFLGNMKCISPVTEEIVLCRTLE